MSNTGLPIVGAGLDYCRELAFDQPLIGSAPEGTRWILVEDNGRWGAKAPFASGLPGEVEQWLRGLERPGTRIHLIRRPIADRQGLASTRRVILAATPTDPEQRRMIELDVELDELARLDVDALLAGGSKPSGDPLWLVCTHGNRDRCCAKWGMPVFDALRERAPDRVWQSSHLGGHRFAPIVVALPLGLMWGRSDVDEITAIADALAQGQLEGIEGLRGRMCWPAPAQAAEVVLRRSEPQWGVDALVLDELVEIGPGRRRVGFVIRSGERRSVEVEEIVLPASPASCGDPPEPRRAWAQAPQVAMT